MTLLNITPFVDVDNYFFEVPKDLIDLQTGDYWTKCLVDTGTDILVLKTSVVDNSILSSARGKVKLTAAFDDDVQATLVNYTSICNKS